MEGTNPRPAVPTAQPNRPITSSDRIKELNEVDGAVAQLLYAAGEAIRILGSSSTANNLSSAKSLFLQSITTYFTVLSSIDVRLRRQVYALQEAGLIADGDAKDAKRGATAAGAGTAVVGTGGPFDLSWVNSRGDQAEKDMEREVWSSARLFFERLAEQVDSHEQVQTDRG